MLTACWLLGLGPGGVGSQRAAAWRTRSSKPRFRPRLQSACLSICPWLRPSFHPSFICPSVRPFVCPSCCPAVRFEMGVERSNAKALVFFWAILLMVGLPPSLPHCPRALGFPCLRLSDGLQCDAPRHVRQTWDAQAVLISERVSLKSWGNLGPPGYCLKTVSRWRKQVVFLLFCGCAVPPKRVT